MALLQSLVPDASYKACRAPDALLLQTASFPCFPPGEARRYSCVPACALTPTQAPSTEHERHCLPARRFKLSNCMSTRQPDAGTMAYMAPECFQENLVTPRAVCARALQQTCSGCTKMCRQPHERTRMRALATSHMQTRAHTHAHTHTHTHTRTHTGASV